jgi:tetratricopeptide (TPR) repeat protein
MKAQSSFRLPLATLAAGLLGIGVVAAATFLLGQEPDAVAASREARAAPLLPTAGSAPICHGAAMAAGKTVATRLAASRTEVPPSEIQATTPAPDFVNTDPPVWDGLGTVTYKITTSKPEAQTYFDQGLRLTYAFNHTEAQRAFREAQKLDPQCAMCFWGEALVLGPNINLPMPEDAVAPAFAAARKAQAMAGAASPREQKLIAALTTRYVDDPKADRKPLDAAYAAAMAKVAAEFPDDDEIAVLYAEAVMDVSPWNYWQPGGQEPTPETAAIVPTLERVLARNPNHPGAMHYYIHAVEASDRPERAEPVADRLRGAVPAAGHLVHMPSHIYYRLGRYLDALTVNKTAVAVDETYLDATRAPMGVYRLGYYPHNIHFVMASAQMAGDGPVVVAAAEKLRGLIPDDIARTIAMTQPVKAAPYFAHAQFSAADTILALPDPGATIPYVQAMWRYARGVAYAGKGDVAAARGEAVAIATIEHTADFSLLQEVAIPAEEVLQLARAVLLGRIAQAQGNGKEAIAQFEQAAALQDALPYMEPPYWYYPVRQTLAAALLQAGRLNEAEEQFRLALARAPNNGWSYYGLAEVYKARGDSEAARKAETKLDSTWIGDRGLLQVSKL